MTELTQRLAPGAAGRDLAAPFSTIGRLAARLIEVLLQWQDRAIQRRRLGQLNERMLRDIGLDRADIRYEIDKPFWRA